jgi:hypothetical protein
MAVRDMALRVMALRAMSAVRGRRIWKAQEWMKWRMVLLRMGGSTLRPAGWFRVLRE